MTTTTRPYTMTAYRDDPVDFIETITDTKTRDRHYRCVHCGTKAWVLDCAALERFVEEHETCQQ